MIFVLLTVPPPIELMIADRIIHIQKPIYSHGIIIQYEIIAIKNISNTALLSILNISAVVLPFSQLFTETGTYSVKVCDVKA